MKPRVQRMSLTGAGIVAPGCGVTLNYSRPVSVKETGRFMELQGSRVARPVTVPILAAHDSLSFPPLSCRR